MATLLPALVLLLPLLIAPGILFHYDITPKIVILTLMVAGCLSLPGANLRRNRGSMEQKERPVVVHRRGGAISLVRISHGPVDAPLVFAAGQ